MVVGSWPALGEVAQKARKESEKENKPLRGGEGVGGEEGEEGKVVMKEKKVERRVSVGGETRRSEGGGVSGGVVTEKGGDTESNGDSQRLSGRRKGTVANVQHM